MSAADETQTLVTPLEVTSQVAAPPEPPKPERGETSYVLLMLTPGRGTSEADVWRIAAEDVTARSAEAAVRSLAEGLTEDEVAEGAVLVAVPTRSWKPVRVKPKTVTTLEIEEA